MGEREPPRRRGVRYVVTEEQIRAFRAVPLEDRLAWLDGIRELLLATDTPERCRAREMFRRGEV